MIFCNFLTIKNGRELIIFRIQNNEFKLLVERGERLFHKSSIYCCEGLRKVLERGSSTIFNRVSLCETIQQVAVEILDEIFIWLSTLQIEKSQNDNDSSKFMSELIKIGFARIRMVDEARYNWIEVDSINGPLKLTRKFDGFIIDGDIPLGFKNLLETDSFFEAIKITDQRLQQMNSLIDEINQLMEQLIKTDNSQWPFYRISLRPGEYLDITFDPEDIGSTPKFSSSTIPWDLNLSTKENLLIIFGSNLQDLQLKYKFSDFECSICASIWQDNLPSVIFCNSCSTRFHYSCCKTWLDSDPRCKKSFGKYSGQCPSCDSDLVLAGEIFM